MGHDLKSILNTSISATEAFRARVGDENANDVVERFKKRWTELVTCSGGQLISSNHDAEVALLPANEIAVESALNLHDEIYKYALIDEVVVSSAVHSCDVPASRIASHGIHLVSELVKACPPPQVLMTGRVFQDAYEKLRSESHRFEWRSHGHFGLDENEVPLTLFGALPAGKFPFVSPEAINGFAGSLRKNYDPGVVTSRYLAMQDSLRSDTRDLSDLEKIEFLCEALLEKLDWMLDALACGPVLCSFKIPTKKSYECVYRRLATRLYALLGVTVEELSTNIPKVTANRSYAGRSAQIGKCIIVPRFSKVDSNSKPEHQPPGWTKGLQDAIGALGIEGVAVCPIYLTKHRQGPSIILKVELFENGGALVDDQFSRNIISLAANFIGVQMGEVLEEIVRKNQS